VDLMISESPVRWSDLPIGAAFKHLGQVYKKVIGNIESDIVSVSMDNGWSVHVHPDTQVHRLHDNTQETITNYEELRVGDTYRYSGGKAVCIKTQCGAVLYCPDTGHSAYTPDPDTKVIRVYKFEMIILSKDTQKPEPVDAISTLKGRIGGQDS